MTMSPEAPQSDRALFVSLAQTATHDASELLRAELTLAKQELRQDLRAARTAALGLIASVLLMEVALALFAVGILLLLGTSAVAALVLAAVFAAAAFGAWLYATHRAPDPLSSTQRRVERDIHELVEANK